MTARTVGLALGVAALVSLSSTAGCGGGGSGPSQGESDIIGVWIEDRSIPENTPRLRGRPEFKPISPNIRQISFTADHNFKLIVCTPDGSPIPAAKDITGTWDLSDGLLRLEIKQNNLAKKYEDWVPETSADLDEGPDGTPRLNLYDASGQEVLYKRTGG